MKSWLNVKRFDKLMTDLPTWEGVWERVGTTVHPSTGAATPGEKTFQVTVTRDLDCIVFQNFYTHSFSIAVVDPPKIIFSNQLMEYSYAENDAQAWHAVYAGQFSATLPSDVNAVTLEFKLTQPSSIWTDKDFSLRCIQAYVFHRSSTDDGISEEYCNIPPGLDEYWEISSVQLEY